MKTFLRFPPRAAAPDGWRVPTEAAGAHLNDDRVGEAMPRVERPIKI